MHGTERSCDFREGRSGFINYLSRLLGETQAGRLHFQKALLSGRDSAAARDAVSGDAWLTSRDESEPELFWWAPELLDLADFVWLVHDYGQPAVRTRAQRFPECQCRLVRRGRGARQPANFSSLDSSARLTQGAPVMSSTPILGRSMSQPPAVTSHKHGGAGTCCCGGATTIGCAGVLESGYSTASVSGRSTATHSPSHSPRAATTAFTSLQEEVKRLQQQIALLVVTQEQMASKQWMPGASLSLDERGSTTGDASTLLAPPPPASFAPPPPPPPPPTCAPPPPPPSLPPPPPVLQHSKSVQDIIAERRREKHGASAPVKKAGSTPIDMSAVLKDLGKVKLKSLAKSPGGTPIRDRARPDPAHDAAAFIQSALRRKFSLAHVPTSPPPSAEGTPSETREEGEGEREEERVERREERVGNTQVKGEERKGLVGNGDGASGDLSTPSEGSVMFTSGFRRAGSAARARSPAKDDSWAETPPGPHLLKPASARQRNKQSVVRTLLTSGVC